MSAVINHPAAGSAGGVFDDLTEPPSWPELVPFNSADTLPTLDLSRFPDWLGKFSLAVSRNTETPPELAGGIALAVASLVCARAFDVEVTPGYREPANLYTVTELPPGCRKSGVLSWFTGPLIEWEKEQAEALRTEIAETAELRATGEMRIKQMRAKAAKSDDFGDQSRAIAKAEAELPDVPIAPRLFVSDATPEALGKIMAEQDGCVALLSAEGGMFQTLAGRYSQGVPNLDLVLKAHSGEADRSVRIGREAVFLDRPRLSIGMAVQPDVVDQLSKAPSFAGRGLLARFLWFRPPSPLGHRTHDNPPVPDDIANAYTTGLASMLNWTDGPTQTVRLSAEAFDEWAEYRNRLEVDMRAGGALEHLTGWAGKAAGAAIRIAGVFHGVKNAYGQPWAEPIPFDTMQAALEVMACCQRHSVAVLGSMGADPVVSDALRVLRKLQSLSMSTISRRDLHRSMQRHFSRADLIEPPLLELQSRGYVRIEWMPSTGGAPPSPMIHVRPGLVVS